MTNIHQGGRERAINHDVPKSRTLGGRILHGLGRAANRYAFSMIPAPVHGPVSLEKDSAASNTLSFLDAQAPDNPLAPMLDELDARSDAASQPSVDEIVLYLVPESRRPDEPSLN